MGPCCSIFSCLCSVDHCLSCFVRCLKVFALSVLPPFITCSYLFGMLKLFLAKFVQYTEIYSIHEADESYPINTRGLAQVFVVVIVYQQCVMLIICIFMFCLSRLVLFSVVVMFTFTSGPTRSLLMSDDK